MEQARKDTEIRRLELLDNARQEITEKRIGWHRQVVQEKQDYLHNLKQLAVQSVQNIAQRAFKDLADTDLEKQIIESFIKQLKSMDETTLEAIAQTDSIVEIKTAFKLEQTIRARLVQIVNNCLGDQHEVTFAEVPDIMCGVELTSNGRRLSWSLANYLDDLEQRMQGQLDIQHVSS
jgi:F-type H+-transporting ATPase subunit b